MSRVHQFVTACTAGVLLALGGGAQAALVGPGDAYTFSWNRPLIGGDGLLHTLSGSGSMTLSGFGSGSLSVTVALDNTSSVGGAGGDRLVSFGFGIDPNAASLGFVDAVDGGMVAAQLGGGSLGSLGGVEICVWGGVSCDDGSSGGIFAGATDVFTVTLSGLFGSVVDIGSVALRYRSGNVGVIFAPDRSSVVRPPQRVPEPGAGALALLAIGLLASARRVHRERRPSAAAPQCGGALPQG